MIFVQNHDVCSIKEVRPMSVMSDTQSVYNYKIVRQFAVMTVIWGIVGMLVGVIVAAQLVWPELNFSLPG